MDGANGFDAGADLETASSLMEELLGTAERKKDVECQPLVTGTCLACGAQKGDADLAFPDLHMWWNFHGRPDDPSRHSTMDMYCETSHNKMFYSMTRDEFIAHVKEGQGKNDLEHYRDFIVQRRQARGPQGRLSKADWTTCPEPTKVKLNDISERAIIAPSEVWKEASDFKEEFGKAPEEDGYTCEWF